MALTTRIALWIAVGMLGGTLAWSKYESRCVSASTILLDRVPCDLGDWKCSKSEESDAYGSEVKTLIREYVAPGERRAEVILQGTYTRLGGLRDWPLAHTTGGWTIAHEETRALRVDGSPIPVNVRLQRITKGERVVHAVSWYTSPQDQAGSLARAETKAWRDRLVGRRSPWLGLYVAVSSTGKAKMKEHEADALGLASAIAPHLPTIARESEL
ncbi:MAG: exosortase-associated EpsI family protein [Armatimonadetes bacterium]|nr:exosortase-associated EpsI family protein [Armatimonadota bacterium]